MRITPKQQAFVVAYIELQNCSAAYRTAYNTANMKPKTVHEAASRLLKNSKVAARIAELTAPAILAAGLSVERTLREIARVAYADPRKLYRADGTLLPIVELDEDAAGMIAAIEVDEVRRAIRVRMWDKNQALEKAFKYLGLYERETTQRRENLAIQIVLVGAPTNERK
jgi:phage terminase small subunit